MFKLLNKKKNNKGFTLVELVIVIAILAILVGLLAPQYTKYVEKSKKSADVNNMDELIKAVEVYVIDNATKIKAGTYEITITDANTTIAPAANSAAGASTTANLKDVFNEFAGNDWANTKLKSKNWTSNTIKATIVIDANGSVTVSYTQTDIKDKTTN